MAEMGGSSPRPERGAFDPVAAARRILRLGRSAALATTEEDGKPFASLVSMATSMAGSPVILISRLARHTRNLERDRRAALLIVAQNSNSDDPLAGARLTICGRVMQPDKEDDLARRFLAAHHEAAGYARFGDFSFRYLDADEAHLVAGFGRIVTLPAADLLIDLTECADLAAVEADAVEHMNNDHGEAVRLYATRLCGAPDGDWRITGIDPEGADLISQEGQTERLHFPQMVRSAQALRQTLKQLAESARGGE